MGSICNIFYYIDNFYSIESQDYEKPTPYPNLDKPAAKDAPVGNSRYAPRPSRICEAIHRVVLRRQAGTKQELINCKSQTTNPKQILNYNIQMTKTRLRRVQSSRLPVLLNMYSGILIVAFIKI